MKPRELARALSSCAPASGTRRPTYTRTSMMIGPPCFPLCKNRRVRLSKTPNDGLLLR
jgi:hypothetical protein